MSATPQYGEFAAWLRAKMHERRLHASGLARQIWGTTKDSRGYDVARNRDRIGHYLAGTSYPSLETLYKLAEAFGVFPDDIPGGAPRAVPPDEPSIHHKLDRIIDLLSAQPAKEPRRG